jgi:hypothetical protein
MLNQKVKPTSLLTTQPVNIKAPNPFKSRLIIKSYVTLLAKKLRRTGVITFMALLIILLFLSKTLFTTPASIFAKSIKFINKALS